MTDDFYIVDLADINVVLGVQWLSTLGPITTDCRTLERGFNTYDGTRAVLQGMSNEAPRIISSHGMEVVQTRPCGICNRVLITTQKTSHDDQ